MVATSSRELQDLISNAIKKVGCKRENDLCRYLPIQGGYMHHFTWKKMKHQLPEKLGEMIKTFIIQPNKPISVPPKQRAARGSRKKKDNFVIEKQVMDRIITLAKAAGDRDLIRRILPKKELALIKKQLISCIRRDEVNEELWLSFSEAITSQK